MKFYRVTDEEIKKEYEKLSKLRVSVNKKLSKYAKSIGFSGVIYIDKLFGRYIGFIPSKDKEVPADVLSNFKQLKGTSDGYEARARTEHDKYIKNALRDYPTQSQFEQLFNYSCDVSWGGGSFVIHYLAHNSYTLENGNHLIIGVSDSAKSVKLLDAVERISDLEYEEIIEKAKAKLKRKKVKK